ncbi:related to TFA1 - TFIIE subunit (transcription initiation factor), 66 kD [Melanopsichium pennsylvanicum]|uniref:Related to TFA1 - TFIIE subunit (Transcription initiation factor), 66 kD n=2 Tax=Melanopsichium pennsylvanicum TaxID=63383 RepID=A0AAJ5C615_9BASI|nr:related to TFA1-TFIIE subunit (transcription initiation factor), 66 kD [Melanopsichium pennsylvanicum 4]SNX85321.1 related to TFA1 - TFIIE subunit (transcription initiation factor), 66 kD [Melanopsichium pennsylvanicum]
MSTITGLGRAGHDSDVKLATEQQLSTIRRMAQIVTRIFYDDRHIVLMDQLVSITVLPADVLAHRLGIQVKELAALSSKLLEDKLICTFRRNEIRDAIINRSVPRTYYYLDYKLFLDVTKWRMMSIRKKIDTRLRNELDNKGYVCPRCKSSYSTLQVAHLLDILRNIFVCETPGCNTELVDNEEAHDVKRSKDSLMRFNEQLSTLLGGLRRTEGITLPPLDVGAWLTKHAASQPWYANRSDHADSVRTSVAVNGAPALQVDLASNDPAAQAARRAAKQKAEHEQRKQNALPAWHLASTVSGEQTALGRKQQNLHSNNAFEVEEGKEDQDGGDDDYYAQYASLQNAEAEARASQAPTLEQEDEFDDFEDVIADPSTTTVSRKRSLSPESGNADNKKAKTTSIPTEQSAQTGCGGGGGGGVNDDDDDDDGLDDFEDVV